MKNRFDQMKEEILKDYPHVDSLPFLKRTRLKLFGSRSSYSRMQKNEIGYFWQHAVLVDLKYVLRWGQW